MPCTTSPSRIASSRSLPFFHIYGLQVVMNLALRQGATLVTMPKFELEPFLALLQGQRITRAFVVPPLVLALARHPAVDGYDLDRKSTRLNSSHDQISY